MITVMAIPLQFRDEHACGTLLFEEKKVSTAGTSSGLRFTRDRFRRFVLNSVPGGVSGLEEPNSSCSRFSVKYIVLLRVKVREVEIEVRLLCAPDLKVHRRR